MTDDELDLPPAGAAFVVDGPTPCKDDPEVFFPSERPGPRAGTSPYEAARRLCQLCPAQQPCLEWALAHDERFGVWGGLSPDERRVLARNRKERSA